MGSPEAECSPCGLLCRAGAGSFGPGRPTRRTPRMMNLSAALPWQPGVATYALSPIDLYSGFRAHPRIRGRFLHRSPRHRAGNQADTGRDHGGTPKEGSARTSPTAEQGRCRRCNCGLDHRQHPGGRLCLPSRGGVTREFCQPPPRSAAGRNKPQTRQPLIARAWQDPLSRVGRAA